MDMTYNLNEINTSSSWALDGGEWPTFGPGYLTSEKELRYPLNI
jgi:hypothetical protein